MKNLISSAAVGAVAALCTIAMLAAAGDDKTARAQRFELIDAEGTVRAFLGLDDKAQPVLELLGPENKPLVRLSASGRPGVLLFDSTGKGMVSLGAKTGLSIGDPSLGALILVGLNLGDAQIAMRGSGGKLTLMTDEAGLSATDANGVPRLLLSVNKRVGPRLVLFDEDMTKRLYAGFERDKVVLRVADPSGDALFQEPK